MYQRYSEVDLARINVNVKKKMLTVELSLKVHADSRELLGGLWPRWRCQ